MLSLKLKDQLFSYNIHRYIVKYKLRVYIGIVQ